MAAIATRKARLVHMDVGVESPQHDETSGPRRIRRSPTGYYPDFKVVEAGAPTTPTMGSEPPLKSFMRSSSADNFVDRSNTMPDTPMRSLSRSSSTDTFVARTARRSHKSSPARSNSRNSRRSPSRVHKVFQWVLRLLRFKRCIAPMAMQSPRVGIAAVDSHDPSTKQLKKRSGPLHVLTIARKIVKLRLGVAKSPAPSKMGKSPSQKQKVKGVVVQIHQRWT